MLVVSLALAQSSSHPDPASAALPANSQPPLPDAPSEYEPLSGHQKFNLFLQRTYSPYTFASAAAEATCAQMLEPWPEYGGGVEGWGKRFGSTWADTESRPFVLTFLPI